jgi:dihydroorotate dehydrogenase electron transfer subunit
MQTMAADDAISLRGPGGQSLTLHRSRPRPLLIGEGTGIGPTLFIAERVRELPPPAPWRPLVLLGSTGLSFPFRPRPSVIVVPGIPTGVIACMPLLEQWGVASRLASPLDLPGCFEGSVIALADTWLSSLSPAERSEVEFFANGPDSMTREALQLAGRHGVACQDVMALLDRSRLHD